MKWKKDLCWALGHNHILRPVLESWFRLSAPAYQSQIIYIVMYAGIADIHQDTTVRANRYVTQAGHHCI